MRIFLHSSIKRFFIIFILLFFNSNISIADFKKIKKKAEVTNPEIIFPIPKNLSKCITDMYVNKVNNPVLPVIKVYAPPGMPAKERCMYQSLHYNSKETELCDA